MQGPAMVEYKMFGPIRSPRQLDIHIPSERSSEKTK
jgi:hypothetical protein